MENKSKGKWFQLLDFLYSQNEDSGIDCLHHCDGRCCPRKSAKAHTSFVVFFPYELEFIAEKIGSAVPELETLWNIQRTEIELSPGELVGVAWTQACPFIEAGRCGIYQFRPFDCRSWPVLSHLADSGLYFDIAQKCPLNHMVSPSFQRTIERLWNMLNPELPQAWWQQVLGGVEISDDTFEVAE